MASLRAKTGCLTCRRRRVKCGEERPLCCQCGKSKRDCLWPEAADLQDRRYRKHRSSRRPFSAASNDGVDVDSTSCSDAQCSTLSETRRQRISLSRELDTPIAGSEVEAGLIQHYISHLVPALLLPGINGEYHGDCRSQTLSFMLQFESVRYSVLACSASSKFILGEGSTYRDMSLQYYAQAVKRVSQSLSCLESTGITPPYDVLIAVVYLYTNGLWGLDTFEDALKHVNGAMELLKLRSTDTLIGSSITRPFDRIIVESVFYQAFLLAVRYPFEPKSLIDTSLLIHTERLLASLISEGTWTTEGSPILGAPLRLYRLILAIVSYTRSPNRLQPVVLAQMKESLKDWENFWLHYYSADADLSGVPDPAAIRLLILAASLLLEWVAESSVSSSLIPEFLGDIDLTFSSVSVALSSDNLTCTRWQVQQALDILRRPGTFEKCTRCYLGSWPVLIIGYAVHSEQDIGLVRQTLRRMQQCMGYGETQRMLNDLESVWSKRHTSRRGQVKGALAWD